MPMANDFNVSLLQIGDKIKLHIALTRFCDTKCLLLLSCYEDFQV